LTITEPGGEIHLEHVIEPLRAPGDAALIAVVGLVAAALAAWGAATVLILAPHADHLQIVGLGVAAFATALTLIALNAGLDVARRRRLVRTLDTIRALARSAHAETVEHLAALVREVEQLGTVRQVWVDLGELAAGQAALAGELTALHETVRQLACQPESEVLIGADDPAARAAASQVFEMGRRIGLRQAARTETAEAGSAKS
jgi:hypothetical protein